MSNFNENSDKKSNVDLEKFLLTENGIFQRIHYIPNFLTKDEEADLLQHVYSAPKPKWTNLSNRRLQNWGGVVGKKVLISDGGIPTWLDEIINKIMQIDATFSIGNRPNHVLVNEYLPGQGIMPHTDGPVFFPLISTVSLGSHTFLDFYKHLKSEENGRERNEIIGSIFVEPRSLLLISGDAYNLLHGILERREDDFDRSEGGPPVFNKPSWMGQHTLLQRSTRVSLTIRNVPNVQRGVINRLMGFKNL